MPNVTEMKRAGQVTSANQMDEVPQNQGSRANEAQYATKTPIVSVIMPVYNAERFLEPTLRSLLSQTYTDFELIIINDASTDGSLEVLKRFNDPRIRLFENPENMGIVRTRRRGFELARGKYIAVTDNDDISAPTRIEHQLRFLEEHPDHGMCGYYVHVIDSEMRIKQYCRYPTEDRDIKTFILFNNCFLNSSVMIRKSVMDVDLYKQEYDMVEDYYIVHQVSAVSKVANLPEYGAQYRIHGNNSSLVKAKRMFEVRQRLDRLILGDAGIAYTEDELEMHTRFFTGDFQYFKGLPELEKLKTWLLKIYHHLEADGGYNMEVVASIFAKRWLKTVYTNRQGFGRLMPGEFIKILGLRYISCIWQLMEEKFTSHVSAY